MTIFSFLKNDRLVCKYKLTNAQIVKNTVLAMCSIAKISVLKPSKSRFKQCAQTVKNTVLSSCSNRLIYKYIRVLLNTPFYLYIFSTAYSAKIHSKKISL